jgi:hypothetical protein
MRRSQSLWLLACLLVNNGVEAANTFEMTWSSQTFGPDGPWHAVQITIGTPGIPVALLPGGEFSSHILSNSICSNSSLGDVCYAENAGLYNYQNSNTANFSQIAYQPSIDYGGGMLGMAGATNPTTDEPPAFLGIDVWNVGNSMETTTLGIDMEVHDSLWETLPDGTVYPVTIGSLALGAPGTVNQSFSPGNGDPLINATLLPGYLANYAPSNKVLSSLSYGLQIGSVGSGLTPSLYFGGFDQNRALGDVSVQEGGPGDTGAIDLVDIGLTVAAGVSPWSFDSLGGLLASGNSSIGSNLPVAVESLAPYMALPKSTCDAIAANLPVTFEEKYGLYFWNTSDPQYKNIISSPSCLTFTFRKSLTSNNLTINVPFKLLNLTLQAPIVTTPVQYFPCKPIGIEKFSLGRAFLQAAFVGANWNANNGSGAWFLAQAPGPNIPTQANVLAIGNTDTFISGSTMSWNDTWQGAWKPLTAADVNNASATVVAPTAGSATTSPSATNTGTNNANTNSGLSTGAKAGIGIGCAAVALAILGALFALFRHHQKRKAATNPDYTVAPTAQPYSETKPPIAYTNSTNSYSGSGYAPQRNGYAPGGAVPVEAGGQERVVGPNGQYERAEVQGTGGSYYEPPKPNAGPHQYARAEADGSAQRFELNG